MTGLSSFAAKNQKMGSHNDSKLYYTTLIDDPR